MTYILKTTKLGGFSKGESGSEILLGWNFFTGWWEPEEWF